MEEKEGKDLAQDMKQELIEEKYYENVKLELEKIILDNITIAEKHTKVTEKEESKEIVVFDVYIKFKDENIKIATIDEKGRLTPNEALLQDEKYDEEDKKKLGDMINRLGLQKDEVDMNKLQEQLKNIEAKTKEEIEGSEREEEKDEETNKDDKEQEDEEETKEQDNGENKEDMQKARIAKKYNINTRNIVHIRKEEKITEHETYEELVKGADDKEEIYTIEKDPYTYETIGREKGEKEFKKIEEASNRIHGKNPDITVQMMDKEGNIKEVKPIEIIDNGNNTARAVIKNEWGEPEEVFLRKQEGEQKYWGTKVTEKGNKNLRQADYKTREFIDPRNNSSRDLSKKEEELKKATDLDKRGVPSEEEGVQEYEIRGNSEQNRELQKEQIKEDLYKRLGIDKKMAGAMPGYLDYIDDKLEVQANEILTLMETNKEVEYDEAVQKVQAKHGQKESGGPVPGSNRRRQ